MNTNSPRLLGWLLLGALAWLLLVSSSEPNVRPDNDAKTVVILRESGASDPALAALVLRLRELEATGALAPHTLYVFDPDDPHPFVAACRQSLGQQPPPALLIGVRHGDDLEVRHVGPCPPQVDAVLQML